MLLFKSYVGTYDMFPQSHRHFQCTLLFVLLCRSPKTNSRLNLCPVKSLGLRIIKTPPLVYALMLRWKGSKAYSRVALQSLSHSNIILLFCTIFKHFKHFNTSLFIFAAIQILHFALYRLKPVSQFVNIHLF